jgi:parvulin-like peptidyl-prolyl isomerase
MKNTLFALALFAVVGTAAAQDGKPSKKDKKVANKAVCVKGDACCAKKSTSTAQVKSLPAAPAPAN